MVTIEQFTQKSGFSERDTFVAHKMYKGIMKTEEEWNEILKKDFIFKPFVRPVKQKKIVEQVKVEPEKPTEPEKIEKPKRVYVRKKKD